MRVLILNQYFPPDRAATAQLLGQLVEDLSQPFQIQVICGEPTYDPDESLSFQFSKIEINRVPNLKWGRNKLPIRIVNYGLFWLGAFWKALFSPRPDVVICWTDPPLVGLIGCFLKWTRGSKFLFVSQDVYPEVAQAARKMNDPVSLCLLRFASKQILHAADRVIAVGEDMKSALLSKGLLLNRVKVISNWQDTNHITPQNSEPFREKMKIPKDAFVIMHSGNIGLSQDLDALLEAALETLPHKNILYVMIGEGARKKELHLRAQEKKLTNVLWFSYQPYSALSESLAAGDLHYVSLQNAFLGIIVPSKIYGILAAGRPVITNVPNGSDIEKIVRNAECGIVSSAKKIAQDILLASRDPASLITWGEKGRKWIEQTGGRKSAARAYETVIRLI